MQSSTDTDLMAWWQSQAADTPATPQMWSCRKDLQQLPQQAETKIITDYIITMTNT